MKYVPWSVALAGLIVAVAHALGILWIVQPAATSSPMAPITSLWFILSGIMIGAMEYNGTRRVPQIVASTCTFAILTTLGMVLFQNGSLLAIPPAPVYAALPRNMPSACTMIAFAAFAWWSVARLVELRFAAIVGASIAGTLGAIGFVGFLTGSDRLTCTVPDVSTGMAVHTSLLIVILSAAAIAQIRRHYATSN